MLGYWYGSPLLCHVDNETDLTTKYPAQVKLKKARDVSLRRQIAIRNLRGLFARGMRMPVNPLA
jgi:hypothetical protein